ncbi:MAG: hypothetical protein KAJ51_11650 [Thermoplasmata archaeon]|nr:hypothetical protein [Thermoplasmata archaeon]
MFNRQFSKISELSWAQKNVIKNIKKNRNLASYLIETHLVILLCTLIYGAVLGYYVKGYQIILNAVKIPLLFLITLYIAIPIIFIVDVLLENKISFPQMSSLLLLGFTSTSVVLITFTPLMLFFILTTKDYFFIVMLNIVICSFAGYFGIISILSGFKQFHKTGNWYPSLLIGSFIIIFVGTQLAWTLRPFFHASDQFTRPISGNFYVAVARIIELNPLVAVVLITIFAFIGAIITITRIITEPEHKKTFYKKPESKHKPKQKEIKINKIPNYPPYYYPNGVWGLPQPLPSEIENKKRPE